MRSPTINATASRLYLNAKRIPSSSKANHLPHDCDKLPHDCDKLPQSRVINVVSRGSVMYGFSVSKLLMPSQLDEWLRYPHGRAARLARAGKIPHIKLPDGQIRFDAAAIETWLRECVGELATSEESTS